MLLTVASFPRAFSYFSLDSLLSYCSANERNAMPGGMMNSCIDNHVALPWEIETFATLALLPEKHNPCAMLRDEFNEMMNFIRANCCPKPCDFAEATERISYQMAPLQFQFQEMPIVRFLRYEYFYSLQNDKVSMPSEIVRRFRVSADEILTFLYLILMVESSGGSLLPLVSRLCNVCGKKACRMIEKVLRVVSVSREEFRRKQKRLIEESESGWRTAISLLETYPVVRVSKRMYVPVPWLLNQALTVNLVRRLTIDDKLLRNMFGKEVLEGYLLHLFRSASCYELVSGERIYKRRTKSETTLTPDVVITDGDKILLVDSKASEPSWLLRILKDDAKNEIVRIYSEHLVKLIKRMGDVLEGYVPNLTCAKANLFGIVCVYRDGYVERDRVYNAAFDRLGYEDEETRFYFKTHVAIVGLYEIELFCYYGVSLFETLKSRTTDSDAFKSVMLDRAALNGAKLTIKAQQTMQRYAREVPELLLDECKHFVA